MVLNLESDVQISQQKREKGLVLSLDLYPNSGSNCINCLFWFPKPSIPGIVQYLEFEVFRKSIRKCEMSEKYTNIKLRLKKATKTKIAVMR